jgi:hypothetical protein
LPLAKTIPPGSRFGVEKGAGLVCIEILFKDLPVDRLIVDNQDFGGRIHSCEFPSNFSANRFRSLIAR